MAKKAQIDLYWGRGFDPSTFDLLHHVAAHALPFRCSRCVARGSHSFAPCGSQACAVAAAPRFARAYFTMGSTEDLSRKRGPLAKKKATRANEGSPANHGREKKQTI